MALYTTNWRISFWPFYTNFLFDLFLETRAEILKKKFVVFLVETMTQKEQFKINWPLGEDI